MIVQIDRRTRYCVETKLNERYTVIADDFFFDGAHWIFSVKNKTSGTKAGTITQFTQVHAIQGNTMKRISAEGCTEGIAVDSQRGRQE